jgi:hypothetical protein
VRCCALKERLDLPGEVDLALLSRFTDLVVEEDEAERRVPDADACGRDRGRRAGRRRDARGGGLRLADDLEERLAASSGHGSALPELAPARLVRSATACAGSSPSCSRACRSMRTGSPARSPTSPSAGTSARNWSGCARTSSCSAPSLADDGAEPVGKRLSFLTQEMNRETNTIGSKANDAAIEHQVIAIKDEIERLREQIENVE